MSPFLLSLPQSGATLLFSWLLVSGGRRTNFYFSEIRTLLGMAAPVYFASQPDATCQHSMSSRAGLVLTQSSSMHLLTLSNLSFVSCLSAKVNWLVYSGSESVFLLAMPVSDFSCFLFECDPSDDKDPSGCSKNLWLLTAEISEPSRCLARFLWFGLFVQTFAFGIDFHSGLHILTGQMLSSHSFST